MSSKVKASSGCACGKAAAWHRTGSGAVVDRIATIGSRRPFDYMPESPSLLECRNCCTAGLAFGD